MSRRGAEQKSPWSAVPREVKDSVAGLLGSPVVRASPVYGGYAPSATFRVVLADGRRSFLKSAYPLPAGSHVRSLAGICGYFSDRAWRPPHAGLPRLRSVQRRQLRASLAWAARRLALPEPTWLAAVAD